MSDSGVNAGFAKCFLFFIAVVILLQGGVYLGLSIWGITLRQCSNDTTDVSSNPFQFAMELIYFLNEDCGNPSIKISNLSEPVALDVDFNKTEPVEYRTFIFLITYAVISTLWVLTSLLIITTLCGPITKTVNGLCFWPWYFVVIAGSVLDAVATGYHIHDIINTTSVVKVFEYLSVAANEKTVEALSNFDAYFVTPAVVMTCISSRVILIWLLNIFGSSFSLSLSNTLSKRNSSKQSSVTSLATTITSPVADLRQELFEEIASLERQQQQQPLTVVERSKPTLPSLPFESMQTQPSTHPGLNENFRPYNIQSPTAQVPKSYPTTLSSDEPQPNIEEHADKLNYLALRNPSPHQQELSPISPLNNRYSTSNENFQFPMQNQRVSEELRGQLPWSYTIIPLPMPKKPQMQVYPDIPPPDYGQ